MCGVGGCLLQTPLSGNLRDVSTLLNGVRQRGPDDEGAVLLARGSGCATAYGTRGTVAPLRDRLPRLDDAGMPFDAALVHARYAIIDLSPNAHQPFADASGTVIAAWNGEIYNYRELGDALKGAGVTLRTASDTEVLVEGYRHWGDDLWGRMNGFWAVALYDIERGALVVARDRVGVAPLYYRETPTGLFFASLIRPLLDIAPVSRARDDDALLGFLGTGLKDLEGTTVYRDVRSFPAATVLRFDPGVIHVRQALALTYWTYPSQRYSAGDVSLDEAAGTLRERLTEAVALRLRSDRPMAFELSGGLDSSSIVACAATVSPERLTSFTIKVPERDEEPFARALSERFNLDYRVLQDLEGTFSHEAAAFAAIMEEPYHSPNVFTCFAMRRAIQKAGFDVVLSGSGGDEVLAGYEYELWRAAAAHLRRNGRAWHAVCHAAGMHLGSGSRLRLSVAELIGLAKRAMRLSSDGEIPQALPAAASHSRAQALRRGYMSSPFREQLRFQLQVAPLPYYLRSSDHFTMSLPLEHRFPFLDVRLMDFALRLPPEYLFRNGYSKYVLRRAMASLLPAQVTWRRDKLGFPFPLQRFLRAEREHLAPLGAAVASAGLWQGPLNVDALLARDPEALWRICSTGHWLRTT
jgi:asparagine synthase (glutamine-hydrolysing)